VPNSGIQGIAEADPLCPVEIPSAGASRVDPALEELTEFTGDGFDNFAPPDTQLAVGPSRLIEMVNVTVEPHQPDGDAQRRR